MNERVSGEAQDSLECVSSGGRLWAPNVWGGELPHLAIHPLPPATPLCLARLLAASPHPPTFAGLLCVVLFIIFTGFCIFWLWYAFSCLILHMGNFRFALGVACQLGVVLVVWSCASSFIFPSSQIPFLLFF